jgi:hypothetical protein
LLYGSFPFPPGQSGGPQGRLTPRHACDDNKKPPKFGNNTVSLAARPAYKAATASSFRMKRQGKRLVLQVASWLCAPWFPGVCSEQRNHSVLFDSLEFITALPSCQERREKCFGSSKTICHNSPPALLYEAVFEKIPTNLKHRLTGLPDKIG